MANKFFPSYDKFGAGVDKTTERSNGFGRYFAVFFRKFWSLSYVNLIYLIIFAPLAALTLLLVNLVTNAGAGGPATYALCFAPMIFLAPANAGITKITRDFGREEPCFIWADFWESAKKNFKQSLALSVIAYLGAALFLVAGSFYYAMAASSDSFLSMLPMAICIVLFAVFLFLLMYAQLMIVTLDLKMKPLLKNAAILSLVALGKNVIALLGCGIFIAIYAYVFYLALGNLGALILLTVLTFMLFFAFISYTVNYVTFPVIKKYIIDPYYKANPGETAEGLKISNSESEAEADEQEEAEKPEYVYENGRLVHRSVIENEQLFRDNGNEKNK